MCSIVENEKESHNKLHQVKGLVELVVALLFIFNNAAHIRGLSYFN